MQYPVWFMPGLGGGLLIALIAIVHVFVSHFAVGGGLYLVLTEHKALREGDPDLLEFTRRHAKFFMLVTLVLGGITGVGIWFIIALIQPAGVSMLIHTFVYGWAAEWVWFLVEIVAILVYYYTFGHMDNRSHLIVGWIYFGAAWLSLFLINGIIGFMLTPGDWIENRSFWAGFFNPSFWPALFLRSFIAFMLAGSYAFVTSAFLRDRRLKLRMTRYSGLWVLISLLLCLPCAWWYLQVLPGPAAEMVLGASPTIQAASRYALVSLIVLFLLALLLAVVRPAVNTRTLAILALIPAFVLFAAFEWTREAARRPFVIHQHIYANGIALADADLLRREGFLVHTPFAEELAITDVNPAAAGAEIFKFQCYACHTIGGLNNDIRPLTAGMTFDGLTGYLRNVMHQRPYMPPFLGTAEEAQALAAYVVGTLHGKSTAPAAAPSAATTQQAPSGRTIYIAACTGCHTAQVARDWAAGQSEAEIAAGLQDLGRLNAVMQGLSLEESERRAVATWLAGHPAPAEDAPETTATNGAGTEPAPQGATLFANRCTGCHGRQVVLDWAAGQSATEIATGLQDLGQLNAVMEGLSLTEDQRRSMAEWLSQPEEEGAQ